MLSPERGADVVALDDALKGLAEIDPRKCRVVELRYFSVMCWSVLPLLIGFELLLNALVLDIHESPR